MLCDKEFKKQRSSQFCDVCHYKLTHSRSGAFSSSLSHVDTFIASRLPPGSALVNDQNSFATNVTETPCVCMLCDKAFKKQRSSQFCDVCHHKFTHSRSGAFSSSLSRVDAFIASRLPPGSALVSDQNSFATNVTETPCVCMLWVITLLRSRVLLSFVMFAIIN